MLRADLRLYRYKCSFKRHRTRANVQTFKPYIQVEPQLLRAIEPELRPYYMFEFPLQIQTPFLTSPDLRLRADAQRVDGSLGSYNISNCKPHIFSEFISTLIMSPCCSRTTCPSNARMQNITSYWRIVRGMEPFQLISPVLT